MDSIAVQQLQLVYLYRVQVITLFSLHSHLTINAVNKQLSRFSTGLNVSAFCCSKDQIFVSGKVYELA
jgi:hypothetical protein